MTGQEWLSEEVGVEFRNVPVGQENASREALPDLILGLTLVSLAMCGADGRQGASSLSLQSKHHQCCFNLALWHELGIQVYALGCQVYGGLVSEAISVR